MFGNVLGVLALALGGWIAAKLKKPTDLERATLLSTIAQDAAAMVLANNPTVGWVGLLEATIRQIAGASGLPTRNAPAIKRAASGALIRAGAAQLPTKVVVVTDAGAGTVDKAAGK
jgi:DNA-binding transcriptional regulator YdaS (Cro superfamily)